MNRNTSFREYGLAKKQQQLEEAGLLPGLGSSAQKTYRCDVIFGSPSADCRGTGICKITAQAERSEEPKKSECKRTRAMISMDKVNGEVSLLLFPEFLCMNILRNQLRNGVLVMKEPCHLPSNLVASFGLETNEVSPGSYPMEIKLGYYKIKLLNI
jgi:hypothetical protein